MMAMVVPFHPESITFMNIGDVGTYGQRLSTSGARLS
jgi:hypothetical protein